MAFRAGEWDVLSIPEHSEAVAFLIGTHYAHGASNTSTYRHGLYRRDSWPFRGDLLGVALWIPPTRAAAETVAGDGWQGVMCLSRFAVVDEAPHNAESYLLGRSMRLIDRRRWPVLLTYADTAEGHVGTIYKATNWECLGPVPAGDTWVGPDGAMRGRKRGGHTLTARDMEALGFVRRPNEPKIKYVHRARKRAA